MSICPLVSDLTNTSLNISDVLCLTKICASEAKVYSLSTQTQLITGRKSSSEQTKCNFGNLMILVV
jgi:hypothetical protein